MKKLVCAGLVLVVALGSVSLSFAEIREEESRRGGPGLQNVHERILCVDELKVLQKIVFGFKGEGGAQVTNIQVMEKENGKFVPARCSD